MNWDSVYQAYPVNNDLIWLNNCGTTPAGDHICREINSFLDEYSQRGIFARGFSYNEIKTSIQKLLSQLLNSNPEDIAIIHNTSEGMNLLSYGFDLNSGDEIILLENEYPSNVYPWEQWEKKGVKLIFTPLTDSPESFFDALKNSITSKTRLISLSAVHWCTGMPLPINDISSFCKEKNIHMVLDAAQGAGHVPLDINKLDCFMSFSAWKWLLGPLGLGVLVIPGSKLSQLKPVFKGTESVVNDLEYLPYKNELKPSAERYMYSTSSIIDWIYFKKSLEFLNEIGFNNVMNRIYKLADYLADKLKNTGFKLLKDNFGNYKTGIIVAEKKGVKSADIVKHLTANGIIVQERLSRIRFAPHIYNSFEQIDRLIEVIKDI